MTARQILRVDVVASVFNGKTPSKLQQRDSGHSVLKIKDVDKLGRFRGTFSGHVDPQLAKKHVRQQLVGGETLVLNAAHSATHVASKTFYAGHEVVGALATGEWLIVRWRDDTADPRYGNHWINAAETRFRLRRLVNGIHLYPKDVARLQIPLPPLAEQKRIAGILDAADALRAKRREALAQLDTLLQSTFLDMFGDPVTNPMGWEVRPLQQLIQSDRPITYGILKPGPDIEGGVPYVRVVDIQKEQVLTEQLRQTTQEIARQYKRSQLIAGDLLMSIRGHVGRMAIVPLAASEANITQDTARLALSSADPAYVMQCLTTQGMQQHMARRTKGVAVKGINLGDVKEIPIPVPALDLQHRFTAIVESVEQQKTSQRAHLDELDTLFASLQSRAFRGDL